MTVILFFLISVALVSAQDDTTLMRFRNEVVDNLDTLHWNWNISSHTCHWIGVNCSAQGRVIGLSLENLQFSSALLGTTIQELKHLQTLYISRCNFTSAIEGMNFKTCSLEDISIVENQLNGSLPDNIFVKCTQLRRIDLSRNQLSGPISSEIFGKNLEHLDISRNQLRGSIPSSFLTNSVSLRFLSLSYNRFSGTFPILDFSNKIQNLKLSANNFSRFEIHSDRACKYLIELDISSNSISGQIFHGAVKCSSLKMLNISVNRFSEALNDSFGIQNLSFLNSLELFDASYNEFTGQVLQIHENIKFLNLSSNNFNTTPQNFCSRRYSSKLKSLLLPNNQLVGSVIKSFLDCNALEMLDLSFNMLSEVIPSTLCDSLPHLQYFLAWINRLQGRIPPELAKCTNLTTLILSYNNLEGAIPPELSQLRNLYWLSLTSNRLSGGIPSSFAKLENLVILQLSNNSLEGSIDTMSKCIILDIGGNLFSGQIPARIGVNFTTKIYFNSSPIYFTDLGNAKFLIVFKNDADCKMDTMLVLQGIRLEHLQQLLENWNLDCTFMLLQGGSAYRAENSSPLVLDMSNNNFSGEIPKEIGGMQSLLMLRFAHNFLTGPIPDSMGELHEMQALDFSYNSLSGGIPDTLSRLSFLSFLNVSYNNLSGQIPQGGQLTTFEASSYRGNPALYGYPLANATLVNTTFEPPLTNEDSDDGFVDGIVKAAALFFVIFFAMSFVLTLRFSMY